jgi:type IV secretion/conjugal transfer VirB4 family ATPase
VIFPEHRRRYRGLADLLLWAALVDEGVVLNKDGSLLAGWEYRGPDLGSATPEQLAALSLHVDRALHLGSNWMIHADALRHQAEGYPAGGAFPDPVTCLIDHERRDQFQHAGRNFDSRYTLVLTFLPPAERQARIARALFERGARQETDTGEVLATFRARLDEVEDTLSAVFEIRRLDSSALLTHLHTTLTGLGHPVAVPPVPCYLDCLLASADLVGGHEPRIGDHHLAVVALMGLPHATAPAMLESLQHLPFEYRWSNRFLALDPATAASHITGYRRRWFQKRRSLTDVLRGAMSSSTSEPDSAGGFSNQDAITMAEDADAALALANSGSVRFGYYTSNILLTHTDRSILLERARQVLRTVRNLGIPADLERVNAVEAFRGSLPGHGFPNVRRPLIHTRNLAHLLPTTSVWAGEPVNPSPLFPPKSPALLWAATAGTTPYRLNLHAGSDVGHTLVLGPTGAGKSTLVALLQASFFRYPNARVFVFDKGGSSFPLCAAAGGQHYDIGASSLGFYPLQSLGTPAERAWAADWLEQLFTLQGISINPSHRAHIQRALELIAHSPERTLTVLATKLQDQALRTALRPYTVAGLYGSFFDAAADPLHASRYSVFEMASILEYQDKAVTPLLLYLFHRIEQRLDGTPTLIILEEAWTFLANTLFAERIQTWLRELRKKNAAVVFVTQSLSDLHNSPLRDVLYGSCPTRILLANPSATSESAAPYYRAIGLNERELSILASAVPKRNYYVVSPQGRRLIDLTLGPATLSFVGASSREDLRAIEALRLEYPDTWPIAWLLQRNLRAEADRLEQLFHFPPEIRR